MANEPHHSATAADDPAPPPIAQPAFSHAVDDFRPLHPNVLSVWRLSAGIAAALFGAFALVMVVAGVQGLAVSAYIAAAISGAIALLFTWSAALLSAWRYAAWRYAVRQHDVVASFGVFWRTRRCIPRLRIQHVDIASGPIDRAFGMANVSLFTAGNIAAVITIPGVTPEEAERLRTILLKLESSDERGPAPPASGQHAD